MDIRRRRVDRPVWWVVWMLFAILISACVPVPIVDTDVRYEKLQKGLYFLVVTGAAETREEDILKRWHQQAFHLCGGGYQDSAQLYDRETDLHRHRSTNFKQYRGDVHCDVSGARDY